MAEIPQMPFETDSHLSTHLANLVIGEFDFRGMNHQTRVQRLMALVKVYEAVQALGEFEHTSDWDWTITVKTTDGEYGYNPGSEDEDYKDAVYCDGISLGYEVVPKDYIEEFSRWTYLTVEEIHPEENRCYYSRAVIDTIETITIEEM